MIAEIIVMMCPRISAALHAPEAERHESEFRSGGIVCSSPGQGAEILLFLL